MRRVERRDRGYPVRRIGVVGSARLGRVGLRAVGIELVSVKGMAGHSWEMEGMRRAAEAGFGEGS